MGISSASGITQTNDVPGRSVAYKTTLSGITSANSSFTLPVNSWVQNIFVKNNTANAVTGGLKFGTTAGGVDIVAALAVGANGLVNVLDSALLKRTFSSSQQIFIDAVVAWNSANVDITIIYGQL